MADLGAVLAVVPARGGSKSIPGKNLRKIGGVSLVGRAAHFALGLPRVDAAVITSDDDAIIAEAVAHGLDAPFVRPAELSSSTALSVDAWRHAWLASEEHYGRRFELSLLLEPTSPLRRPEDAEAVLAALDDPEVLTATTVMAVPPHFAPPKVFRRGENGVLQSFVDNPEKSSIRQSNPTFYSRNGLCYAARRKAIVDMRSIVGQGCTGIIIDRETVNIDDFDDLDRAEALITAHDKRLS